MLVEYKATSHVEFRNSLPKSTTGTVLRLGLVAQEDQKEKPDGSEAGSVEDTG
jgi:acyl-CoA synthetase (AMP-forming)/AMP-acid ligase II